MDDKNQSKEKLSKNFQKIFFKKYKLLKQIKKGSFGVVYEGININTNYKVAIKIEPKISQDLKNECSNLMNLQGFGIPKVISFGYSGKYSILVEELLGESLFDKLED